VEAGVNRILLLTKIIKDHHPEMFLIKQVDSRSKTKLPLRSEVFLTRSDMRRLLISLETSDILKKVQFLELEAMDAKMVSAQFFSKITKKLMELLRN